MVEAALKRTALGLQSCPPHLLSVTDTPVGHPPCSAQLSGRSRVAAQGLGSAGPRGLPTWGSFVLALPCRSVPHAWSWPERPPQAAGLAIPSLSLPQSSNTTSGLKLVSPHPDAHPGKKKIGELPTWPDVCCLVAEWRLFCEPRDRGPPVSSVHGILQARVLE